MDKGCLITAAFMTALCVAGAGCIYFAMRPRGGEIVAPTTGDNTAQIAIARIPWNEIDAIYRITPKSAPDPANESPWPELERKVGTDLKKESSWANYKGRFVEWEGEVVEVKHSGDRFNLSIKMNEATTTKDIILALKNTESAKARRLKPGDLLKFRGRLKSWGSVVRFAMDQGEILD